MRHLPFLAALAALSLNVGAGAHEVQPSVMDVEVGPAEVVMRLRTAVEPLVAGVDLSAVADTDESPLAGRVDALRLMPPEALAAEVERAWPAIAARIALAAGDAALAPALDSVEIPPVGDPELRRDSVLVLSASLPDDGSPVTIGWDGALGGLVVRQGTAEEGYSGFLAAGGETEPLPREGGAGVLDRLRGLFGRD